MKKTISWTSTDEFEMMERVDTLSSVSTEDDDEHRSEFSELDFDENDMDNIVGCCPSSIMRVQDKFDQQA